VLPGLSSAHPGLVLPHPGAPRCSQSSLRCAEVFPNLSQSLPLYSCSSHQRSHLLWSLAGMPSSGLMLSWNRHIYVYTPPTFTHSWRLPVSKLHFADVVFILVYGWSLSCGVNSARFPWCSSRYTVGAFCPGVRSGPVVKVFGCCLLSRQWGQCLSFRYDIGAFSSGIRSVHVISVWV